MKRAVIDQPGLRILAIGLALSFFFGLALSSLISEQQIQKKLQQVLNPIKNDFNIDYASAKIELSSWGLPYPSLAIEKIRISPRSISCQDSQIFINKVNLPISLFNFLIGKNPIEKLRLGEVELRLNQIENCNAKISIPKKPVATDKNNTPANTAKSDDKKQNADAGQISDIRIERLKVILSSLPNQPFLFKQTSIDLSYSNEKISHVVMTSNLSAVKDTKSEAYFFNSHIEGEYENNYKNKENYKISLAGKLIDGDVGLNVWGDNYLKSKRDSYNLSISNVSFKALFPLLANEADYNTIFDKTAASLSLNSEGSFLNKNSFFGAIKNLVLKIDNSTMQIERFNFLLNEQLNLTDITPFIIKIDKLPLTKIKNLEKYKSVSDSFESLGDFSGSVKVSDVSSNWTIQKISAEGKLNNIVGIFSNRGRRDLQTINEIDFKIYKNFGSVTLSGENFNINDKKVIGNFNLYSNDNLDSFESSLYLKDVQFNRKVLEQLTLVEQEPEIDVSWNYVKNSQISYNLEMKIDSLLFQGLKLKNIDLNIKQSALSSKDSQLYASVKASELETDTDIYGLNLFKSIIEIDVDNHFINVEETYKAKNPMLKINGNNWRDMNFEFSAFLENTRTKKATDHFSIVTDGKITAKEGLSGLLRFSKLGNHQLAYKYNVLDDDFVLKKAQ